MSYAEDMGHNIPDEDSFCSVMGDYLDNNGRSYSDNGLSLEQLIYKRLIQSDNPFEEANNASRLHIVSNKPRTSYVSNTIDRKHRCEEDEIYANPDFFELPKSILDDIEFQSQVKDFTLTFGKYKGESYREVCKSDPGYIKWALENVSFFPSMLVKFL